MLEAMLTGLVAMSLGLPGLSDSLSMETEFQAEVAIGLDSCVVVASAYDSFDESLVQGVGAARALDLSLGLSAIIEIQVKHRFCYLCRY